MTKTVWLLRQLCTDPIARDPRIVLKWYDGPRRSGISYVAELTGNPEVKFHWHKKPEVLKTRPKMRGEPRAPCATCTNALFAFFRVAQRGHDLCFPSITSMAQLVFGNGKQPYYQWMTTDSLRIWQQLGVEWSGLLLPPPIEKLVIKPGLGRSYGAYEITLSREWLDLCDKKKAVRVRLPLPMNGTSQNIVLKSLVMGSQDMIPINQFYGITTGNKRCEGVVPHIPLETWHIVRRWYQENGGRIDWQRLPYTREVPKRKRKERVNPIRLIPSRHFNMHVWRPGEWSRAKSQRS